MPEGYCVSQRRKGNLMKYAPERHRRRSIRLRGYDYSQPGAYFITIVAHERQCLFGTVVDGEMRLNKYGVIVHEEWLAAARIRPYARLDENELMVMPNHVHGIIWIVDTVGVTQDIVGATRRVTPTTANRPVGPARGSIGAIIGQFKSATTKRINATRGTPGSPVWQRNYYEHIIRNDEPLKRIRQYIATNPLCWAMDRENPDRSAVDEFDQWLYRFANKNNR